MRNSRGCLGNEGGTRFDQASGMRTTVLLAGLLATASATTVAAEPTVDRLGIVFHLKPHQPDKKEWKWSPNLRLKISGPISSSSAIVAEYTLPNGKPWVKVECENVSQTEDNEFLTLNDCGNRLEDKDAITQTGVFGFTVKLTDALSNTNKVLFKGKFTVGRGLYNPSGQADRSKQFYYYVDQDWRLPLAYVFPYTDDATQNLYVENWIKGPIVDASKIRGYLFYRGKQVSEDSISGDLRATPPELKAWEYHQVVIKFPALVSKPVADGYAGFKLWENPGEYEFKLMRDNKVVRTAKFTIGPDGKPKDSTGARASASIARDGILIKTTVDGGDGTIRKDAYKTEAFFHNPPSGL